MQNEHVEKIAELICQGATKADIAEYIAKKNDWKLSTAQLDVGIKAAKALITKSSKFDPAYAIGQGISRLNDLFRRAFQIQDYKTALAVQKEINKLLSLAAIPREPEDEPSSPQRPDADPADIFGLIDAELGHLATGPTQSYSEIIKSAAGKLRRKKPRPPKRKAPRAPSKRPSKKKSR